MMANEGMEMNDSQRLVRIETLLIGMATRDDDHETRIRRMEKILWLGMGFSAAVGSAAGSYMGSLGGAG